MAGSAASRVKPAYCSALKNGREWRTQIRMRPKSFLRISALRALMNSFISSAVWRRDSSARKMFACASSTSIVKCMFLRVVAFLRRNFCTAPFIGNCRCLAEIRVITCTTCRTHRAQRVIDDRADAKSRSFTTRDVPKLLRPARCRSSGGNELAHARLEQRPGARPVDLAPALIERAELPAEAAGVGLVDDHAFRAKNLERARVDLRYIRALRQRRGVGMPRDHGLDVRRQRLPLLQVGVERKPRPPVVGDAEVGLHLIELQQHDDLVRIGLPVDHLL